MFLLLFYVFVDLGLISSIFLISLLTSFRFFIAFNLLNLIPIGMVICKLILIRRLPSKDTLKDHQRIEGRTCLSFIGPIPTPCRDQIQIAMQRLDINYDIWCYITHQDSHAFNVYFPTVGLNYYSILPFLYPRLVKLSGIEPELIADFWYTLYHELWHIKYHGSQSKDLSYSHKIRRLYEEMEADLGGIYFLYRYHQMEYDFPNGVDEFHPTATEERKYRRILMQRMKSNPLFGEPDVKKLGKEYLTSIEDKFLNERGYVWHL